MSEPILRVRGLQRDFGGVRALDGVNLEVARGAITGLIGPNGSGKTTLFQVVSGVDRAAHGEVFFDGEPILGLKPYQIYQRGLARTFQLARVFARLTVLDNLIVAAPRRDRAARSRALELLERVELRAYAGVRAAALSYGQQKLLEFLRVLMSDPSLILLDEPAAGVNPRLRQILWDMVRHLNALGTSFLIIEHNMEVIADLCSEVYVLNEGVVIARGRYEEIASDVRVLEAYFGRARDAGAA